jgi:ribose 5-phosphate isomerase B
MITPSRFEPTGEPFAVRIAFANDHAAYQQRDAVIAALNEAGHEVLDFGSKTSEPVDYPDFVAPAAEAVAAGQADRAVTMCGSGIGASIVANKVPGVRCALVTTPEDAELSRRHNDANALALSSRTVSLEANLEIVKRWLETPFDGGRHQRRIDKIKALEARRSLGAPRVSR